eukprot:TRINITY_DN16682_c0_g1_i1.p1 TRINITY_DN16682_c0_g1~~TRINITY_DN16682_c0_g1_i1.p1  ORF type:complete len:760 (+),score=228.59 TRINITY_DN16682_c0_g1_i1:73-2280(+)
MLGKIYLLAYNLASCFGWAYILFLVVKSYQADETASELYEKVGEPLMYVQSAALLEVFHSLLGLVRSPVVTTLMQVASRLLLVWGFTSRFEVSQAHWSLFLMAGSWALVEVPRYLFYALNLFMKNVPYPVFFLRYSLFMVLYPSGITGEIMQMVAALATIKSISIPAWYAVILIFLVYLPGSPFMYFHMVAQRKRASRARTMGDRPPRALEGLVFPKSKGEERSTTAAGKAAFAAATEVVDKKAGDAIRKERNWRFGYDKHVVNNVRLAAVSKEDCLKIANAGLEHLHNSFEFVRDGKTTSLQEAMETNKGTFHTGFIQGDKKKPRGLRFEIPYKEKTLTGDDIVEQCQKWAEYGTIEPEAAEAISLVAKNPKWCDLSDKYFVLLGAGSAMGPLLVLMSLGANVIAVDLDRPGIWKRLIGIARNSHGTMTFPLSKPEDEIKDDDDLYASAGCNLFTQTPEIKNWLLEVQPGKALTIGGYAYLDGALHVQVSLAMDAIMKGVSEGRKNVGLAFLCSPTDVFVAPNASWEASRENLKNAPWWQKLISTLTGGRLLTKNALRQVDAADGSKITVVDGIVVPQGPNYALAKRLQHWRVMVASEAGNTVSSNIAPSTATASVVSNASFAAAYGGFHHFKPMEIFYQETSNAVMGALLLHDVCNPKAIGQPKTKRSNPLEIFASGAFHGGIWRSAWKMNSEGPVSVMAYYCKIYFPHLVGVTCGAAGFVAVMIQNGFPHQW